MDLLPCPVSSPLVATLGASYNAPAPGVEMVEVFHFSHGPLAGMLAGRDGQRWAFECVRWGEGPVRVWVYWPLQKRCHDLDAAAALDALARGAAPLTTPTYSVTSEPVGVVRAAAHVNTAPLVGDELNATIGTAADALEARLDTLPAELFDPDTDLLVASLRLTAADPDTVETARAILVADPSRYVPAT